MAIITVNGEIDPENLGMKWSRKIGQDDKVYSGP